MWLRSDNPARPRNDIEDDKEVLAFLLAEYTARAEAKQFAMCDILKIQISSCLLGKQLGIPCSGTLGMTTD